MTLIKDLGEDADLLTRSDAWLEQERRATAAELNRTAQELRAIQIAQRIKKALQQKNLVAARKLIRGLYGIEGVAVQVQKLSKALEEMRDPADLYDYFNTQEQLGSWKSDGYDVTGSA
jgi:hypothetical protein